MTPEQQAAAESQRKDRELNLKEREVAAKEKEVNVSRWSNPVVLGLFAAAVGLIGNVFVARVNNQNTQAIERLHTQSTLILQAIKTDENSSCNNLIFFVKLGLIDDPNNTIRSTCPKKDYAPPSLPASSNEEKAQGRNMVVKVVDEEGSPIHLAIVTTWPDNDCFTDDGGICNVRVASGSSTLYVHKDGYVTLRVDIEPGPPKTIILRRKH
jgi:hypothetical protein